KNVALDYINQNMAEFPKDGAFYIHCAGGYRSLIAASILKSRGYHNMIDVKGGFKAIQEAEIETTAYVCPSTL
ncbi:MAG: rhodanese-like domain-containing protein, partial [Salibacteraceae bacterium]|nr:rhodanese-like domain-containing protein [Salibacteraceae bacterium]